jgi:hypothetical protein
MNFALRTLIHDKINVIDNFIAYNENVSNMVN